MTESASVNKTGDQSMKPPVHPKTLFSLCHLLKQRIHLLLVQFKNRNKKAVLRREDVFRIVAYAIYFPAFFGYLFPSIFFNLQYSFLHYILHKKLLQNLLDSQC